MAELLTAATRTLIAELSPDLSAPSTRSFTAIVTLIWPYSSSNSSLTVLLAEPDFRLRRTRGQVRVQFTGSAARVVFEAGIGSGDKVLLGLEGAEWVQDESGVQAQTPGRGIEWDLRYSERLVLQIEQSETQKISLLDIDHPEPQTQPQPEGIDVVPTSEPESAILEPTISSTQRPKLVRTETNEWASPAFIKRARVSYGSLFESRYDIFAEDDGTIQGRGRKRTRFSRGSGGWRYSSRSPSPAKDADEDMNEADLPELKTEGMPSMTDEGCQTLDFEDDINVDHSRSLSVQGKDIHQISELHDEMLPPPKPNLVLEPEAQMFTDDQQSFQDGATITPLSPRLDPVSSDALPLVSPLISSAFEAFNAPRLAIGADAEAGRGWFEQTDPSLREAVAPDNSIETEDIYGLSPAHSNRQDAQFSESVKLSATDQDGTQLTPFEGYHDSADQYGHWQSETAAEEQTSNLVSPLGPEQFPKETYPEPGVMEVQQDRLQAGPYYGNSRARSPASTGSDNLRKQVNHVGFAMSRSQSARSEIVDLTEESEEDAQTYDFSDDMHNWETQNKPEDHQRVFLNGSDEESDAEDDGSEWGSSDEGQIDPVQHHEDLHTDESEAEDEVVEYSENVRTLDKHQVAPQHYHERRLMEESGDEEDEELSYDEDDGSAEDSDGDRDDEYYNQGFQPVNDDQSQEQYDEDEEEVSYDEEDLREEAGRVTVMKKPQGEPEVIDLLSSDEEDVEDNVMSRRSREIVDERARRDSEQFSVDESENGIDADAELIGEVNKEVVSENEDSEDESRNLKPKGEIEQISKPTLASEIDDPMRNSSSPEPEEADAEVPDTILRIVQQPISFDVTDENRRDHHIENKRKTSLLSTGLHDGFGGMDGAADEPVNTADLSPTLSLDKVAAEEAPVSPRATNQEINKKDYSDPEDDSQDWLITKPITQLDIQESFSDEHLHRDHFDEKHANGELAPIEPAVRSALSLKIINNESINQLHDREELSSRVKVIVEKDHMSVADDQQLPTPDATQLTAELDPRLSFHSDAVIEPRTPPRLRVASVNGKLATDATRSPSASTNGASSPDSYDASAELALSVLESPSNEARKESLLSNAALRVKLTRPLHTTLGAFTPLKLIRFHLEQKLDVIVLATTQPPEPQRAKNGARHYHVRFNIIDASISPIGVIGAQIFRPYKSALPTIKPGDGVLLRNFVVKAEARASFALRSDEGSSWVVFKDNNKEEIRGPPVEYGDGEREYVANLKTWLKGLDDRAKERLDKLNSHK